MKFGNLRTLCQRAAGWESCQGVWKLWTDLGFCSSWSPCWSPTPQKKSCFLGFLRNCSVGKSMIFFLVMLIPAEGCIAKRCFVKGYAGNQGEKIPQHWTWGWAQWRPFTFLNTPLFHFLFLLFIYYIYVWHIEIHIYLYYIILVMFFFEVLFWVGFFVGEVDSSLLRSLCRQLQNTPKTFPINEVGETVEMP